LLKIRNFIVNRQKPCRATAHIAYIQQLKIQDNCYYVKGYGTGELWEKFIAPHELRVVAYWMFFTI